MKQLLSLFAVALTIIDPNKVRELFDSLGYENVEPTADACLQILDNEGKAFSEPFGQLVLEANKTKKAKKLYRQFAKFHKSSGSSPMSDEMKQKLAEQGITTFGNILNTGVQTGNEALQQYLSQMNQKPTTSPTTNYQEKANYEAMQEQQKNLYWILGGVGVFAVILVIVIVVAMSKK